MSGKVSLRLMPPILFYQFSVHAVKAWTRATDSASTVALGRAIGAVVHEDDYRAGRYNSVLYRRMLPLSNLRGALVGGDLAAIAFVAILGNACESDGADDRRRNQKGEEEAR